MAKITGDSVELQDLEELVAGNDGEIKQYYDPAENGVVYTDEATGQTLLIVRESGQVAFPAEVDVEDADITQLISTLDVNTQDLTNISTASGGTADFTDVVAGLVQTTDVDADKLVSNLSANGYTINAIGLASVDTVSTSSLEGTLTNGVSVSNLPGAGLSIEGGDLVVTAEFSGISGLSNPLVEDLNADGFNIENVGRVTTDELTDEDSIGLVGTSFEGAGYDEVDVPQVRNLTVEDWESGTLDTDVWEGATAEASVQSSTVESGSYALGIVGGSSGINYHTYSHSGIETYPQAGDEFTAYAYLTDTDDIWRLFFGLQDSPGGNTFPSDTYFIEIRADTDEFRLRVRQGGDLRKVFPYQTVDISSHLNEWLEVRVEWGIDGDFTGTLTDASGTELASGSGTDTTWTEGGVGYNNRNNNVAPTTYFDTHTLKRRLPEYTSETKKGATGLGNEVIPSGAIHTGPLESNTNALRQEYATAPVNSDATQGDKSLLTLLKSGVNPAMYMERTFNGQGGAYGHQLEAALGRFARINANLSWEYESFAETEWLSNATDTSIYDFTLEQLPRKFDLHCDGSNGVDDYGGIYLPMLVTHDSLGAFRIVFEDVKADNVGSKYLRFGVTDADIASNITSSGSGVWFVDAPGSSSTDVRVLNDGNINAFTEVDNNSITKTSTETDLFLEFDGSTVRAGANGGINGFTTATATATGAFRPFIQWNDTGYDGASTDLEFGQVTVEPLPEVLQ